MHDLDDESVKQLFGEAIIDELKAIREYLNMIPHTGQRLLSVEDHISDINGKITVISALGKAHEKDLRAVKHNLRSIKDSSTNLGNQLVI